MQEYFSTLTKILSGTRCKYLAYSQLPKEDAEDVLQQTFLELAQQLPVERQFNYTLQALRFNMIKRIESRARVRNFQELNSCVLFIKGNQLQKTLHNEKKKLLETALSGLPSRQKLLMVRSLLGYSREQIMEDMHLAPHQYRMLKWRAKAQLIKLLSYYHLVVALIVIHLSRVSRVYETIFI